MFHRVSLAVLLIVLAVGVGFAAGSSQSAAATTEYGFNESGYPIVTTPVTLRVATRKGATHTQDWDDMIVLQKAEEVTNVHIDWISIPSDAYDERLNLMIASGDLPDTINSGMSDFNIVSQGEAGVFKPMQDLIERYAPNINRILDARPTMRGFITAPDGNIYSVMRMNEGSWTTLGPVFYVNRNWMQKLGVTEVPRDLEGFYDLLVRVKEAGDLNGNGEADEIPLGFRFDDANAGLWNFFFAHGLPVEPDHMYVRDGRVQYAPTTTAFRDTVEYLHRLWSAGLMDQEGFSLSGGQYSARIKQDQYFAFAIWQVENVVETERWDDYDVIAPMAAPGYDPQAHYRFAWFRGYNPIIEGNRYPEVTMRWTDYWYDTMNSIEMMEGPIGVRLEQKADGTIGVLPTPAGLGLSEWRDMNNQGPGVSIAILAETYRDTFIFDAAERKGTVLRENYTQHWPDEYWPRPMMSSDDIRNEQAILPDIRALVSKNTARWITEGGSAGEWSGFQRQLEAMGLPTLMDMYQRNYDFFKQTSGGRVVLPY